MKTIAIACIILSVILVLSTTYASTIPTSRTDIASFLRMWRQYQRNLHVRHLISDADYHRFNMFYELLQPYLANGSGSESSDK